MAADRDQTCIISFHEVLVFQRANFLEFLESLKGGIFFPLYSVLTICCLLIPIVATVDAETITVMSGARTT